MHKTVFMPQKGKEALMSDFPTGIIVPKDFLQVNGELVNVDQLNSMKPLETFDSLDLEGFLPEEIANICGFQNDKEALEFVKNNYSKPDLQLTDLMAYRIRA